MRAGRHLGAGRAASAAARTIRVPGRPRRRRPRRARSSGPTAPNVLWVADITYLRTWEGWLYLAAVQDAYSRRIVGWAMADHMRTELVVDALQMAVARRRPAPGLIHHSDQGSQPGLKGSSQHRVVGEVTVALGAGDLLGWAPCGCRRGGSPVGRAGAAIAARGRPPAGRARAALAARVSSTGGRQAAAARCSSRASAGVFQPRVLRGRLLSAAATAARSSALQRARSVPLGKYWRSSPLVFSLVPRCQGLCGSQK